MPATRVLVERRPHTSYLLRLWQAESDGSLIWRASLQAAGTPQRRGFATVADLLRFLEDEYGPADPSEITLQDHLG